jgi:hypothetical protein
MELPVDEKPPHRLIPRIFEGAKVFICAGGPSLSGFRFDRLAGKRVIAINRALEFVPGAEVLWWSDARFWRNNRTAISAHRARYKATCQIGYQGDEVLPPWVTQYRFTGVSGFDADPRCLRHGNNSSYAAIHLAAHLGARKIVLLGVDMRHGPAGETHFHGGHGLEHQEETLEKLMLPFFDSLAVPLAERGIEVLNASRDSSLTLWPRCSIDEGLACT